MQGGELLRQFQHLGIIRCNFGPLKLRVQGCNLLIHPCDLLFAAGNAPGEPAALTFSLLAQLIVILLRLCLRRFLRGWPLLQRLHIIIIPAEVFFHPIVRQVEHTICDFIDEIAVVGYDQHGALIARKRIFQRLARRNIQVVGRLIQQ